MEPTSAHRRCPWPRGWAVGLREPLGTFSVVPSWDELSVETRPHPAALGMPSRQGKGEGDRKEHGVCAGHSPMTVI